MNEDVEPEVRSSAELAVGDEIEAWHRGRLAHRGTVSSTFQDIGLFWIIDARTGTRRLLDLEQLSVRRIQTAKAANAVGLSNGTGKPRAADAGIPANAVGKPAARSRRPVRSLSQVVFIEAPATR
ncbi:hypothetical protein [Arthrobacter globiformis]|uniref:hypothetical protein n=1 Tax=Arthrobacter globiformis TaxID=1665 RepID=UPI0027923ED4|nr:hypothetical protein [Arthrobacter globiformis]MDQ0620021.1 hypothetical protein [Arthrobacter globiformis]